MASKDLSWKYVEQSTLEPEVISAARAQSLELGIEPISPATGAQLAVLAAALDARTLIEVGTGLGVSGLWMLSGTTDAHLTSIDIEADHHEVARHFFADAGHPAARVRLITGRAAEVLPRMNEASYDMVLVDADVQSVLAYVEHALRLVRPGGAVLVAHALWRDSVPDPARREAVTTDLRELISELSQSSTVTVAVSPVGDGLLQVVTRRV